MIRISSIEILAHFGILLGGNVSDSKAIQLKLDELIRAVGEASNSMIDIEELSDKQLQQLQQSFRQMHDAAGTEHISGAIQEEMD